MMVCESIIPPVEGKSSDWPWEQSALPLPEFMPNGQPWPRISIVTPSYNQGQFIEQTIRSVLLQGYPNLEYIIVDGGSSDNSVEIIKKYEKHLAFWVSEKDRGQSHAINKGFERASGQIICWLNSDDYYPEGTLRLVAEELADGTGTYAIAGHCRMFFSDGRPPIEHKGRYDGHLRLLEFWRGYYMHQPSIFWRREVFEKVGLLDEKQHLIMDFDYWARISKEFDFKNIDQVLSCVNHHEEAKTGDGCLKYHEHLWQQTGKYWGSTFSLDYWRLRASAFYYRVCWPYVEKARWFLERRLRHFSLLF